MDLALLTTTAAILTKVEITEIVETLMEEVEQLMEEAEPLMVEAGPLMVEAHLVAVLTKLITKRTNAIATRPAIVETKYNLLLPLHLQLVLLMKLAFAFVTAPLTAQLFQFILLSLYHLFHPHHLQVGTILATRLKQTPQAKAMRQNLNAPSLKFARDQREALTMTGGANGTSPTDAIPKYLRRESATLVTMLLLMWSSSLTLANITTNATVC